VAWHISRILEIRRSDWLGLLLSPTLAGLVLVGGVLLTKAGLATVAATATVPILALLVFEGAALYLVSMRVIAPDRLTEFVNEVERLTAISKLRKVFRGGGDAPNVEVMATERSNDP
jgi:hypothetical protein